MITTANADAAAYASAVRDALRDLEPDVLEELTGGLEADLAELAMETDTSLQERLGSPVAYAMRLRTAAGLESHRSRAATLRSTPSRLWAYLQSELLETTATLRGRTAWTQVRDFLVAVRPAWWVLRGWVAYVLVERFLTGEPHGAVPYRLEGWLILLALVVLSVQLGREPQTGPPGGTVWVRRAVLAGNVAAVLALPVAAGELADGAYTDYAYASSGDAQLPGLVLDGAPVTNVYAYDADGQPIYGVQLFTADGIPLEISYDARTSGPRPLVPAVGSDGQERWNVYPLGQGRWNDGDPARQPGSAPRIPDWADTLRSYAPPRASDEPGPTPTASPTSTPDESSTTPAPTVVPTPSPTDPG